MRISHCTPSTEAPFIPICIFMPTSMEKFQTLDFLCQSWPNFQWEETRGFLLPQFVRFGTCSCGKHVWGANAAASLLQFFRTVVPFHVCICPKESSYWRRGPYSGTLEKFGIKVIPRGLWKCYKLLKTRSMGTEYFQDRWRFTLRVELLHNR